MTTITIKKDMIVVEGHSGFAPIGHDIICASISVASQMLQNLTQCDYEETEDGYTLHVSKNNINVVVYKRLMEQLQEQYKGFVEVRS